MRACRQLSHPIVIMKQNIGNREEIIHETLVEKKATIVRGCLECHSKQEETFMSSWWSGCYGSGLVLNQKEFDGFLVKYKEWNHMEGDTDLFNEEPVCEFDFVRSIYAGMNFSDSEKKGEDCFWIADVLQDECDGMYFSPYMNQGKKNLYMIDGACNPEYISYDMRSEDLYVIWSDKELDSVQAFDEKPYASYEAFRNEFMEKLQRYLPEDFDWDSHLGKLRYAVYS